jgi:GTP diphosphokinase / guanosine-3',5'-bis(diphosphate) 3'-diphosphatase
LHDTIEDTDTSVEELVEAFGIPIASLVQEVTDESALRQACGQDRKFEGRCRQPPANWPLARRQEYFDWAKQVVDKIPDPPAGLLSLF